MYFTACKFTIEIHKIHLELEERQQSNLLVKHPNNDNKGLEMPCLDNEIRLLKNRETENVL